MSENSDIELVVDRIETVIASFGCVSDKSMCSDNELEFSWYLRSQSNDKSDLEAISVKDLNFDEENELKFGFELEIKLN